LRALRVSAAVDRNVSTSRSGLSSIAAEATLGEALAALLAGADALEIRDGAGSVIGVATVASVLAAARRA
jgi:hypothetical protein